jgi:hypothetical protein
MMSSPASREVTWNLIKHHWDEILQKLPYAGPFLIGEASSFCDSRHETDIKQFFTNHPVHSDDHALQQTLQKIANCVEFQSQQGPGLAKWLENNWTLAPK